MREPGRAGERQLARPGRAAAVILMQVREDDRGQLRGGRSGGGQPGAEPADQRLDPRPVAEEPGAEPGVDDGVAVGRLHQHAVVAARHRGPVPALSGQRLPQLGRRARPPPA